MGIKPEEHLSCNSVRGVLKPGGKSGFSSLPWDCPIGPEVGGGVETLDEFPALPDFTIPRRGGISASDVAAIYSQLESRQAAYVASRDCPWCTKKITKADSTHIQGRYSTMMCSQRSVKVWSRRLAKVTSNLVPQHLQAP
jgi:hypothetical protein